MVGNGARRYGVVSSLVVLCLLLLPHVVGTQQSTITERMGVRHWSGQGVSPVYEGFDINPDGTYNMWFGYMNRNWQEEPDIAVGPDNGFEGGADRGQPTHFAPRRHKDVFKVIVPKDFGTQKITWKITVHGKTESIAGTLNRVGKSIAGARLEAEATMRSIRTRRRSPAFNRPNRMSRSAARRAWRFRRPTTGCPNACGRRFRRPTAQTFLRSSTPSRHRRLHNAAEVRAAVAKLRREGA